MAEIQKIEMPPEAMAALRKETGEVTPGGPTHPQITNVSRVLVAAQALASGWLPYPRRRALMMSSSHPTMAVVMAGPRRGRSR